MHKLILPFLGQELEVYIANTLKPVKLFDIEEAILNLIILYTRSLGLDMQNSDLERLNTSDLNFPVEVSDSLWRYLAANLDIAKSSAGKILPFSLDGRPADHTQLETYYSLRPEDKVVQRIADIKFNSAPLAASFMMTEIESILTKAGIKDFLMHFHNSYLARGNDSWEVKLQQPDSDSTLEMIVNNEALFMQMYTPNQTLTQPTAYNPFKGVDPTLDFIAVIIETTSLLQAKLIANLAEEFNSDRDFVDAANKFECGLTVLTVNGEIKQYSPV